MGKRFDHMCNVVIHYDEDILIATKATFEEHMKAVRRLFSQMETAGPLINPKKVFLAKKEI